MMDHDIDLEAQQQIPSQTPEQVGLGGSDIHVTVIPLSAEPVSTDQQVEVESSPAVEQAAGDGENKTRETDVQQDGPDIDALLSFLVETKPGESLAEQTDAERRKAQTSPATNDQPIHPGPYGSSTEQESKDIRMMGDFDSSANGLWTLYKNEAKSHDEARIQTLKDDMDGVLIFAGLFSAALTSFIIDSKQSLKVNPTDQMAYYLQQNVAMLSQISLQISSITPQIVIPSSPPPPFPDFVPSSSDIRVNVFWFMALVFSLSSALLAILVQQWVRDYMHVYQKYSDSLKAARLRQYLHDGCENWYMPVLAEAVPGLLHVSLFLFFVGLGDAVLHINTAIGVKTVIPIGICGVFYIFTMFAPIFYPQSPYQNSFSGLIWYIFQRLHGRTYKDRSLDGGSKTVSPNMSVGQMQLAMEETRGRMMRDEKAVQWLMESMTEEAEMELFVAAIPGSFNVEWGVKVWRRVSEGVKDEDKITNGDKVTETNAPDPMTLAVRLSSHTTTARSGPALHPPNAPRPSVPGSSQGDNVMRKLCRRVAHLLETCKNPGLFASDEQWRKRARACIETTTSLVGCTNAELGWFGDFGRLLGDIGKIENTGELMSRGRDRSFVLRWTCLSLMSIRPVLSGDIDIRVIADLVKLNISKPGEQEGTSDENAWKNVQKIDDDLDNALNCISTLFLALRRPNLTDDDVKEILHNHEYQIFELEQINAEGYVNRLTLVDAQLQWLSTRMNNSTHGIISQLPGFQTEFPTGLIPFTQIIDLFIDPHNLPLLFPPGPLLNSLCSLAPAFRDMLKGQDTEKTRQTLKRLNAGEDILSWRQPTCLLQRQLWRLQDLCYGGGLGITVELFFISLWQLLSTPLSRESESVLYIGTFRAIISDWSLYKHSLGTQKLLLDAVASVGGIFSDFLFPTFITDELFVLLGNVFDKQTGLHIDDAVRQLGDTNLWFPDEGIREFRAKAKQVIIAAVSASPSS